MNERIRELAEQAERLAEDELAHLERVHNRLYSFTEGREIYNQKFAELIVRECVSQCEQVAVHADKMTKSAFITDAGRQLHEGMWGGAIACSVQIKEHFGVEE